jgi:hypothetical protein
MWWLATTKHCCASRYSSWKTRKIWSWGRLVNIRKSSRIGKKPSGTNKKRDRR